MLPTFLLSLWGLPKSIKIAACALLLLAAVSAYIGYLTHTRKKAEKAAASAASEANRKAREVEGLQILQNTANITLEIQKDKEKANAQAVNANTSNAVLYNNLRRDSNAFASNYADARRRFCEVNPTDSRCG